MIAVFCHMTAKTSQSFFWHGCVMHVCVRGGVGGWEAIFRNSGGVQETMGWCKEAQHVPGSLYVAVIIFNLLSPMWTDTTGLILSVNALVYIQHLKYISYIDTWCKTHYIKPDYPVNWVIFHNMNCAARLHPVLGMYNGKKVKFSFM